MPRPPAPARKSVVALAWELHEKSQRRLKRIKQMVQPREPTKKEAAAPKGKAKR